ncbi:hypothetical protein AB0I60_04890 [Actinosynnema sp. NPDC050436]|uniref:Fic family protein n=1 Tax=Actinosynnema sp. NPDC050436 TaxID=3155659 RepID=UPI003401E662
MSEDEDVPASLRAQGAFIPRPLPGDLSMRTRTFKVCAEAEGFLGRLNEASGRLTDPAPGSPLVRSTQVREVQSSANVDGVSAALLEVLVSQLPGVRPGSAVNPKVALYLRASDTAFDAVRDGAPIDVRLLCREAAAFAGGDVGVDDVWRDRHVCLGDPGEPEAFLLAAPPGPDSVAGLAQFVDWSAQDLPFPLVAKLALGHYQLTVQMPFRYGNGHIARIHVGLELVASKTLHGQVLPISTWIDGNRAEYWSRISRVVHEGDYEQWIEFFARGVLEVCRRELWLIDSLGRERDALLKRISGRNTGNIRRIVAELVSTPVTNHRQVVERYGMSKTNAIDLCKRLANDGILEPLDSKAYNKAYCNRELVRLLSLQDPLRP